MWVQYEDDSRGEPCYLIAHDFLILLPPNSTLTSLSSRYWYICNVLTCVFALIGNPMLVELPISLHSGHPRRQLHDDTVDSSS